MKMRFLNSAQMVLVSNFAILAICLSCNSRPSGYAGEGMLNGVKASFVTLNLQEIAESGKEEVLLTGMIKLSGSQNVGSQVLANSGISDQGEVENFLNYHIQKGLFLITSHDTVPCFILHREPGSISGEVRILAGFQFKKGMTPEALLFNLTEHAVPTSQIKVTKVF
jgi:hypothetical protein